jgi:hypothetical protein
MPWSGEQVRHRGPRETSSEAEAYARGWDPRAGRELARAAKALERGGDTLKGCHTLEQGGGFRGVVFAPRARRRFARGVPGLAACWAAEAFWAASLFCLGLQLCGVGAICSCVFGRLFFLGRCDFPRHYGTYMVVPDSGHARAGRGVPH